jgi:hypothetical protein
MAASQLDMALKQPRKYHRRPACVWRPTRLPRPKNQLREVGRVSGDRWEKDRIDLEYLLRSGDIGT